MLSNFKINCTVTHCALNNILCTSLYFLLTRNGRSIGPMPVTTYIHRHRRTHTVQSNKKQFYQERDNNDCPIYIVYKFLEDFAFCCFVGKIIKQIFAVAIILRPNNGYKT